MTADVVLDKAGRVVLPKRLHDQMMLEPGDTLTIESHDERITLRPVRPKALLKKEFGIWVYRGALPNISIPDLIDAVREERDREFHK